MKVLWWYLRDLPWPFVVAVAISLAWLFGFWLLTRWSVAQQWIRYAPLKARDQLTEMRKALAESELERQRLQHELAKAQLTVAGIRERLNARDLELAEKAR